MSIIIGELKYGSGYLRHSSNKAVEQGELDKGHINEVIAAVVEEVNGCGGACGGTEGDSSRSVGNLYDTTNLPFSTIIKGDRGDLGGDRVAIEGGA